MKLSVFSIGILISILFCSFQIPAASDFYFDKNVSLEKIAKKNKLITKKLLHEMKDDLKISNATKDSIPAQIGLTKKQFKTLYLHMKSGLTHNITIGLFIWVCLCLWTLFRLKKKQLGPKFRITIASLVIVFFGIYLSGRPSAMEALVKFFKATANKETWHLKVFYLGFFSILSILASNLFCSIGCQVGVWQDCLFQIFKINKWKQFKVPFAITNSIRFILFVGFLLFMYNILNGLEAVSLYHNVNLFKMFILGLGNIGIIALTLTIVLGFFIFRPFCALICPFGLWSWAISHLAIFKIRINVDTCTKCLKCIKACPNQAMEKIYHSNKILADCFSCGECMNKCPVKCIELRARK